MVILSHPNPALRQRAYDVDPASDRSLRALVRSMAKTMYDAPGVGLAATQVGVHKRVVVFDLEEGLIAMCNPQIVERSDELETDEEGCLSLPGITVPVSRAARCVCEARDLKGEAFKIAAEGMLARVLQHEVDHLDGVLIIDRATPEDRLAAVRRYRETNDLR